MNETNLEGTGNGPEPTGNGPKPNGRILDPRAVRVGLAAASARPEIDPIVIEPAGGSVTSGPDDPSGVLVDGVPVGLRLERFDGARAILVEDNGDETVRTRARLMPVERAAGPRSGVVVREVVVDGWRFEVEVESERHASLRERARRGKGLTARGGPTEIRAIIPGRIAAVSVVAGDGVEAGQQLLVVEAMKMQNQLRAPREGTITRVAVAVGGTIEVGDLLLVLE